MLVKSSLPLLGVQPDHQSTERYKLVVIGDNGSGKTCLLNAYLRKEFEIDEPWIFEESIATVRVGTRQVEFMLWDLSGHEDYDGLRVEVYPDTDIFIVCFDIGNVSSFRNVQEMWIPEIHDESPDTPFILVGCKNDLRTDENLGYFLSVPGSPPPSESAKSVSRAKAESLAEEYGAKDYVECCAKTRFNVSEVFRIAAQVILSKTDPNYSLNDRSNFGLKGLSRYARRKSAEIGERLHMHAKPGTLFATDKNHNHTRRGSIF